MIAILIIAFLLLFLLLYTLNNNHFTYTFVTSFLAFSTLVALSTELLSQLNLLTFQGVFYFWSLTSIVLVFVNKKLKIQYVFCIKNSYSKIIHTLKKHSRFTFPSQPSATSPQQNQRLSRVVHYPLIARFGCVQ